MNKIELKKKTMITMITTNVAELLDPLYDDLTAGHSHAFDWMLVLKRPPLGFWREMAGWRKNVQIFAEHGFVLTDLVADRFRLADSQRFDEDFGGAIIRKLQHALDGQIMDISALTPEASDGLTLDAEQAHADRATLLSALDAERERVAALVPLARLGLVLTECWPHGDVDGGELQDAMERCGLIAKSLEPYDADKHVSIADAEEGDEFFLYTDAFLAGRSVLTAALGDAE